MPRLHFGDRRRVANQHRVRKVAEHLFGELGLVVVRGDEIGQRPQNATAELVALGQQRGGGRRKADPISFQRFERATASGEHRDILFERATFRHFARLAIPRFAQEHSRLFGFSRLVPALGAAPLGNGGRIGRAFAGASALLGEVRAARFFLAEAFTK